MPCQLMCVRVCASAGLRPNPTQLPLSKDVFIYAPEDLLAEIEKLSNPNYCSGGVGSSAQHAKDAVMTSWGTIKIQFAVG